jgi:hypothetical protein
MVDTRKTVLITGCAPGGIGHALALDFHNAGRAAPPNPAHMIVVTSLPTVNY